MGTIAFLARKDDLSDLGVALRTLELDLIIHVVYINPRGCVDEVGVTFTSSMQVRFENYVSTFFASVNCLIFYNAHLYLLSIIKLPFS